MRALLLLTLTLCLTGCVRHYRAEHHSCHDSRVCSDGSVSGSHHADTQEREWLGLWPVP